MKQHSKLPPLMLVILLSFSLVACSSEPSTIETEPEQASPTTIPDTEKKLVGFVGYLPSTVFWSEIANGIQDQAKGSEVVVINYSTEDSSLEQQVINIQSAIDSDVQGVILGPVSDQIKSSIDLLESEQIPVITVDVPLDHPWVASSVTTDGQQAATMVGEFIRDSLLEQGKTDCQVLIISGDQGQENAQVRATVPAGILEEAGYTVNVNYSPGWSGTEALSIALAEFTEHQDTICAAFSAFEWGSISMVEASESLELSPLLVGFDWSDRIKQMIQEERLSAAIIQDPHNIGKTATEVMTAILANEEVSEMILVPPILVTVENVAEQ